jgi:hypothetical protein
MLFCIFTFHKPYLFKFLGYVWSQIAEDIVMPLNTVNRTCARAAVFCFWCFPTVPFSILFFQLAYLVTNLPSMTLCFSTLRLKLSMRVLPSILGENCYRLHFQHHSHIVPNWLYAFMFIANVHFICNYRTRICLLFFLHASFHHISLMMLIFKLCSENSPCVEQSMYLCVN